MLVELSRYNPWWASGTVPRELLGRKRKKVWQEIEPFLDSRQIILLYGLRRVGKTTQMYQIIQRYLDQNVHPTKILYFSFDDYVHDLRDLLAKYEEIIGEPLTPSSQVYLFFDEIQKLPDWQNKIKILYDLYPKIKIFLSGSASATLHRKSNESLAGRLFEFFVPPLDFAEYLEWVGVEYPQDKLQLVGHIIKPRLSHYMLTGGFPEIVSEDSQLKITQYIKNTVLNRIILQDIPEEFGATDYMLLKALSMYLLQRPGMLLNFNNLASDFQKSALTIRNYVAYFVMTFLVREVYNWRGRLALPSKKARKVYPTNTAFNLVFVPEFEAAKERLYETAVANYLDARFYYRNGFEVDFVIQTDMEIIPIEVKSGDKIQSALKQIKSFVKRFSDDGRGDRPAKLPVNRAFIITHNTRKRVGNVTVLPLWEFLLTGQELVYGQKACS